MSLVVSTGAADFLERLVSEMTYYVLSDMSHCTHSLSWPLVFMLMITSISVSDCVCVCQGNELGGGTLTIYSQELKLPQHTSCHRELLPYADLMNWLKIVDNASFVKLRTVICDNTLTSCHQCFLILLPRRRNTMWTIKNPVSAILKGFYRA